MSFNVEFLRDGIKRLVLDWFFLFCVFFVLFVSFVVIFLFPCGTAFLP